MSFMKKGYRKDKNKVVKDVNDKFRDLMKKMDYLCEISHRLSIKYPKSDITEESLSNILTSEGFDTFDKIELSLILEQTLRNYDEHVQAD